MIGGQRQDSGDNSVNVQAHNVTVGLSFEQARTVALSVFRENFLELQGVARAVVEDRMAAFTDKFLTEIHQSDPFLVSGIAEPRNAQALFYAQKGAALSGEEELSEALTRLVLAHFQEGGRSARQLALSHAIEVTATLTPAQIKILAGMFSVCFVNHGLFQSAAELYARLNELLSLVCGDFSFQDCNIEADISYLEFNRCLNVRAGQRSFFRVIRDGYPALFSKGFELEAPEGLLRHEEFCQLSASDRANILIPCLRNPSLVQLKGFNRHTNEVSFNKVGLSEAALKTAYEFHDNTIMDENAVAAEIASESAAVNSMLSALQNSPARSAEITPVGFAIAHSFSVEKGAIHFPLDIWVK